MKKNEYWEVALEDALDLVAKIPVVAAHIYRRTFKDGGLASSRRVGEGLASQRYWASG